MKPDDEAPSNDRPPRANKLVRAVNFLAKIDVPATALFALVAALGFFVGGPRVRVNEFWANTNTQGEQFEASVPTVFLFVLVYAIFVPIAAFVEFLISRRVYNCDGPSTARNVVHMSFVGITLALFMGIAIEETGKNLVGQTRPEFGILCFGTTELLHEAAANATIIRSNADCPANADGSVDDELDVARQSYISGHASLTIGCAVYLVIYLIRSIIAHIRRPRFVWLRQVLFFLAFILPIEGAGYMATSRVWDGKHSAADVLTGMFVGATSAAFAAWWVFASYELNNRHEIDQWKKEPQASAVDAGDDL